MQRQGIALVGAEASRILGHIHHQKTQAYTTALCSQILVKVPGRHMKEEERDMKTHPSIPQGENIPQGIYLQPKA